jgi:hypothetical protein
MRQQQQQSAEQLASVTAKLEQMSQEMMEIYGLLPNMRPDEANKLAAKLFKGLPGQRAGEEREKKKRRLDDITLWRLMRQDFDLFCRGARRLSDICFGRYYLSTICIVNITTIFPKY